MTVTQLGYHENLINNVTTALNDATGINASDTTITVDDATGLPTTGFFRIKMGTEIIICDGRSGNDLNAVTRGAEGTTAASHSDNTEVFCVLTAEGLERFLLDHRGTPFTQETTWADGHGPPAPLNRMLDEANAALTVSSFTWVNQGSATATDSNGGVVMTIPDEANHNLRGLVITAPTTPYQFTVKANVIAPGSPMGGNSTHFGLWFRESSTGKLITLSSRYGQALAMWRWTNATTFSAVVDTNMSFHERQGIWFRFEDDGTDLKGYFSMDGSNWSQDGSAWWQQGRTSHMSGGPNQIGFYLNSGTNSGSSGAGPAVATVSFECFRVEEL